MVIHGYPLQCSGFSWKNGQKMPIFYVFWSDQAKFFRFSLEYFNKWDSFGKVIKFLNFRDIFQADSTSGSGFGASQSQKIKK